ncbi:postacrosomal sheath WW domain-binding protein [Triplophysa dalaica]|uniref:WW domain-binding protein 2-like n=1 Tax=Triplophysa dalaica TaxID=1582913 RepID=UPI0024DF8919|nr:WW domain-binding protein 2-like [Triplophysa dalaica]XP_056609968.1 postacrosomal sheath WW domain-binding protein [Triplophysa dalaica]
MALNSNHHPNGGVLINTGESILRDCKNVELSFSDVTPKNEVFRGTKKGSVYLTQYRVLFVSSHMKEKFCSFMFPYYLMKNCSIEQPVFAANYIQGLIKAEAGGGWEGQANFKMCFPSGGAIELGQHLFKLASNASRAPVSYNSNGAFGLAGGMNGYASPVMPQPYPYPSMPQAGFTHPPGVYPSAPVYMPPPPPYPGPPQDWCVPPVAPGNAKAAEAASSAFYNPSNPHGVYMPTDQPPPYYPPEYPNKKNN